ncbi:MAG: DUF4153 domain-containing protein [Bacteroidales bacterium]|nr:DUF4153 domain-containing protein [Bacteroidales bacterium]
MSRLTDFSSKSWNTISRSVREFPLEALLGVTYFLVFFFEKSVGEALGKTDVYYLFFWFFPQYVLLFTLHKLSGKHLTFRVLYILSWFLWIPLLICGSPNQGWSLGVAYIIAVILLVIGKEPLENEPYGQNILDTVINVAAGFIIGFLLIAIVEIIIASINFLFDLDLKEKWFTNPMAFIAFVIIPLLCCSFVTNNSHKEVNGKILKIIIDYILSPALVIYTIILYIYIGRIALHWELPNGGVAYIVAIFMAVGLVCHLFRLLVEKRHFEWFYKAFPFISIAPLILLWIGAFRRIGEYGLTEVRVYLICLALLLTIFTAMLVKDRTRNFQLMTLILALSAILFTYIPGIRAKDFGIRSQKARLERVLPSVLVDGKFPEILNYKAIDADPELKEAWLAVDGSYNYLKQNMSPGEFKSIQDDLGDFPFNTLELEEKPETAIAGWSISDISGPIDLGEYNQLIPPSDYHYYEDSAVAIFYKDNSRTEELLRCEIREALDSQDEPSLGKLVYKNDDYMVVFDRIDDFNSSHLSFSTGNHTLYKKQSR